MAGGSRRHARRLAAMLALSFLAAGIYAAVRLAPSRGVKIETAKTDAGAGPFADAFRAGVKALQQGDAHAAAVAFEQATTINPASSDAFVNLGFSFVELNSWLEAETCFERAMILNPNQANAYFGLAESFEGQGRIGAAREAMRAFLRFAAPDDPFRRRAESALWEWGDAAALQSEQNRALPPQLAEGESIYGLDAQNFRRQKASLGAFEGKVLVLNIWASWCPPCRRELPQLDRLAQELDPEKFAVVGLNVDASPDFAAEYLRRLGVRFTSLWDADRQLSDGAFAVEAYPTTLLVGPDGRVRERVVGYQNWASSKFLRKINALHK